MFHKTSHITIGISAEDESCKICYMGNEDVSNPLISPCLCSGSMRQVHHDCVVRWIRTAGLKRCDLCKYPFTMESRVKPFKEWKMVKLSVASFCFDSCF